MKFDKIFGLDYPGEVLGLLDYLHERGFIPRELPIKDEGIWDISCTNLFSIYWYPLKKEFKVHFINEKMNEILDKKFPFYNKTTYRLIYEFLVAEELIEDKRI